MKRLRTVRLLPLLLLLPACVGTDPMRAKADRATFDWFAPMVRGYLDADPKMNGTESNLAAKATHLRGIDAWGARIAADEAAAGVK